LFPWGTDVHSKPISVVKRPGSLNRSAVSMIHLLRQGELREILDQVECGLACSFPALFEGLMPFSSFRNRQDVGCPVLDVGGQAHHVRVIRDHQPVQRSAELDRQPG
jgi:hypothetical protein